MSRVVTNFKLCVVYIIFIVSCSGGGEGKNRGNAVGERRIIDDTMSIIHHAKLFDIKNCGEYKMVEVVNPWDTLHLLQRYILVDKNSELPDSLPNGVVVRTPVDRVITYTAVDVGSLAAIDEIDRVKGVCEAQYILNRDIVEGIDKQRIKDLGSYMKPNVEHILSLNADLIFASPYAGQSHGAIERLGVAIAETAGYMEQTPLARCEWIKFYAAFFGKDRVAVDIFNEIETSYNLTAKYIEEKIEDRPKLIADKKYGQIWFMSPGNSYAAEFYRRAGANYPWDRVESSTALSLSFETVLTEAKDAKIWLFGYYDPKQDLTLKLLKSEFLPYSNFDAYKNGGVYGCNTATVPFYENAPLRPDLVLLDIAKMLHPELFVDKEFTFYKRVE